MKRIGITAPVKNRAWVLPYFLGGLLTQDYPREKTYLIFWDDDSTDDTLPMLQAFREQYLADYGDILILESGDGITGEDRHYGNQSRGFAPLASLRNGVMAVCHSLRLDGQLSIDSDIIAGPELLTGLLGHGLPHVASMIFNDSAFMGRIEEDERTYLRRYVNAGYLGPTGRYYVIRDYALNTVYEVQQTGAVYLIDEATLHCGACYDAHEFGEDLAYCLSLIEHGVKPHIDTTLRSVHCMTPELIPEMLDVYARWFGVPLTPWEG